MSINNNSFKKIATIVLICATVGLAVALALFIIHRMRYAVTDAVFVRTDTLVNLGFERVSGRIVGLKKKEGEPVKKGEVLGYIDQTPYTNVLKALEARLLLEERKRDELRLKLKRVALELEQGLRMSKSSLEALRHKKEALEARAEALLAILEELGRDKRRFGRLFGAGVIPKKRYEAIETKYRAKENELKALKKEILAIDSSLRKAKEAIRLAEIKRSRTEEIKEDIRAEDKAIEALRAEVKNAQKDLDDCTLRSPINGRVAKKYMSEGDMVLPGKVVYSLVNPRDLYILVLLEEGKLRGVRPGSEAKIKIDAYPNEDFRGVVEAVLPASAATFALIPRDVSAGEFTKVAQRIPIRIKITDGNTSLLRIGLGGEVEIKRQ